MLEAFIITLREGIEAALLVGIIVAFLRRESAERYLDAVWWGIGSASALCIAAAVLLYRYAINQEAVEGVLYIASAFIVGSLLIWVWRHAQEISGEMKGSLGRILDRDRPLAISFGIFAFTFLMVLREGVETVLFLSAVSLSTEGLLAVLGAVAGLALAVVFAIYFVRGSLKIDLARFFTVTGIALMVFLVQLLFNGYHELSEAEWVPANPTTMGIVGPLVKNEFFFILAVLALPLLVLLVPGKSKQDAVPEAETNAAEARLRRARQHRQRRARLVGGVLGLVILSLIGLDAVYASGPSKLSPAIRLTPTAQGTVRIPLSTFADRKLHRYMVETDGAPVRFIVIQTDKQGDLGVGFDACEICGAEGYYQDGNKIICRHCDSIIYLPTIGKPGGCNPIPLPHVREGSDLVIKVSDLAKQAKVFA